MSTSIQMTIQEYADCPHQSTVTPALALTAREAILGEGMKIRRLLPHREQRMIGAWCFFDHAGRSAIPTQNQSFLTKPAACFLLHRGRFHRALASAASAFLSTG